jgi:polar amino acid transport system substrate-binding protein
VIDGLRANGWDISILIVDPVRAEQVDFSNPFLQSDLTYLVAAGSTIQSVADADQSGIRIAAPRGDTSDLLLTRALKRAELVRTDNIAAAVELLRTGGVNAIRPGHSFVITSLSDIDATAEATMMAATAVRPKT